MHAYAMRWQAAGGNGLLWFAVKTSVGMNLSSVPFFSETDYEALTLAGDLVAEDGSPEAIEKFVVWALAHTSYLAGVGRSGFFYFLFFPP